MKNKYEDYRNHYTDDLFASTVNTINKVSNNSLNINYSFKKIDDKYCKKAYPGSYLEIEKDPKTGNFKRFGLKKIECDLKDTANGFEYMYRDSKYTDIILNKLYLSRNQYTNDVGYFATNVLDLSNTNANKNKDKNTKMVIVVVRALVSYLNVFYSDWKTGNIYDPYRTYLFNGNCCIGNITVSDYPLELIKWVEICSACYDKTHRSYSNIGAIGITLNDVISFNGIDFGSMKCFEDYVNYTLYCRATNRVAPYNVHETIINAAFKPGYNIYGFIEPWDWSLYCQRKYVFSNMDKIHFKDFNSYKSTANTISHSMSTTMLLKRPENREYNPPKKAGRPIGSKNKPKAIFDICGVSRDPWDVWKY